uniref:POX domain-containing protein n=1 Tax=Cannabis sativa TaxID=3483 RepID=A0A803PXY3_CANSA
MATYFNHGSSEIQGPDGLHTLYLMNPNNNNNNNYVQTYSDTTTTSQPPPPPAPNMFFLNPNQLHHSRHLAGVPISAATASPGPGSNNEADISAFPHLQYNIWGSNMDHHQRNTTPDFATQMGFRRHQVVSPTTQQQALSLSLSSTHPAQAAAYVASSSFSGGDINNEVVIPTVLPTSFGNSLSSTIVSNNSGIGTSLGQVQSMLLGSKYLKAAQELLDEVVNVGNNNNNFKSRGKEEKDNTAIDSSVNCSTVGGLGSKDKAAMKSNGERTPTPELGGSRNSGGESSSSKISAELSTVQRQELQVKKAKLASMLDEVEQRYRQYHQQMNVVISSFEQAVGYGSAKSYTALALKTISKQFRCLKDAISAQIKATSKTLGEEECLGVKIEGSRLRFVDHHLRQQRALQQLGMMPQHNNNAWRPQRGLPERAVSVLRAWLFEHFLHPYVIIICILNYYIAFFFLSLNFRVFFIIHAPLMNILTLIYMMISLSLFIYIHMTVLYTYSIKSMHMHKLYLF